MHCLFHLPLETTDAYHCHEHLEEDAVTAEASLSVGTICTANYTVSACRKRLKLARAAPHAYASPTTPQILRAFARCAVVTRP